MVKMEEEIDKPEWFRGLQIAAQEGSDHLPILYRVEWGKKGREIETKKKNLRILKWKEEKEEEFHKIWLECWEEKDKEENPDPEVRWRNIIEAIEETAKRTGMTTKGGEIRDVRKRRIMANTRRKGEEHLSCFTDSELFRISRFERQTDQRLVG